SGPLAGMHFAAKDLFDVEGQVTGGGNPDWQRTHGPARNTAEAIVRLLDAGADLVGKTQMDELAYGALGQNAHFGTPLNPVSRERVPGGSSSGSASAVAGELVDFALGSDSACSVRLPAALCGIYGMRPTWGRVPTTGMLPLSPSLDTVGWFARTARLMQTVGQILLDGNARRETAPQRLLILEDAFALAQASVREALEASVARIAAGFDEVVRAPLVAEDAEEDLAWFWFRVWSVQVREVWGVLGEWIDTVQPDSTVLNRKNLAAGADSNEAEMAQARAHWKRLRARVDDCIARDTVACLPTTVDVAPLKGNGTEALVEFTRPTFCLMSIAGVAGLPQLTLPLASIDGLAVGVSLIGPRGSDEQLVAIGRSLEEAA
ncbi:MAG: amidase, partial [Pseudomonadales bacterium]